MSAPHFTVELDTLARRMHVATFGLWDIATVIAYERALDRELARYRRAGGEPGTLDILIDLSHGEILPLDVAERLKGAAAHYVPMARRVAILSPHSAIKRLAARRIASSDKQRICATRAEAMEWLHEPMVLKAAS